MFKSALLSLTLTAVSLSVISTVAAQTTTSTAVTTTATVTPAPTAAPAPATATPATTASLTTVRTAPLRPTHEDRLASYTALRRELMKQAIIADDFHETHETSPVVYAELSEFTSYTQLIGHQPTGSLSGRIMYCSAGHGWTNDTTSALWYTQRPELFNIVEDFGNIDQMNLFADICYRAGATIVPLRPLGHQPLERIVDNSREDNVHLRGEWYESSSDLYYGNLRDRVPYLYATACNEESAVARFQPYIPKSDYYPVYCWARDGADRITQTYRIVYAGGVTEVKVNHKLVGKGWVYLGEFYFVEGMTGYVEVTNLSTDPYECDGKHVVIADAIRFGNGMGDINRGGGISGRPREEEASRYWIEESMAKRAPELYEPYEGSDQSTNVGAPPRMSAHMNRESEGSYFDRMFTSFHSNAAGGRGVVGLYNKSPELRPDKQVEWAEMTARQINEDLTTSGGLELPVPWAVRQRLTVAHIDFGELRRDYNNNEMVATIVEVAFHDNPLDAMLLRMPEVRYAAARATYKAALKFLNKFHSQKPAFILLPEPPVLMSVQADSATSTTKIEWLPPHPDPIGGDRPASYRLYSSKNGYGFDGGVEVGDTTGILLQGGEALQPMYYRVAAVNPGGESRPSKTLGSVIFPGKKQNVLVVDAFETVSEDIIVSQTAPANLGSAFRPGGEFVRLIPRLMNAGNYTVAVGDAVSSAGRSFDSCSLANITSSTVSFRDYDAVILSFGRQGQRRWPLSDDVQSSLTQYARRGGKLFVHGSNAVAVLDGQTTQVNHANRDFARNVLKSRIVADDDGIRQVIGASGNPLSTATITLDDGSAGSYNSSSPDALAATNGGRLLLQYANESKHAAAVTAATNGSAVAAFGFPFETIVGKEMRLHVMNGVLDLLKVPRTELPEPPPSPELRGIRPGGDAQTTDTVRGRSRGRRR